MGVRLTSLPEPLVNVVNDLMLDMIGTILTTILLLGSILGVTLISMPTLTPTIVGG
jgi:hypothetical protein